MDKKEENMVEYKRVHVSRWIRRKRTWLTAEYMDKNKENMVEYKKGHVSGG